MSATFILEYAGAPVRISANGCVELMQEQFADRFASEADAWLAVHRSGLNPKHCRVVNLYLRHQEPVSTPKS